MNVVMLYTDGACSGNPGPGGWAALLRYKGNEMELAGSLPNTTNNQMELAAVIEGLSALKEPCVVQLYSDSKDVRDSLSKGWVFNWEKNGWKKADKSPAQNKELWMALLAQYRRHQVQLHWVRGHVGHPENERCDKLAVAEYQKYMK